MTSRPPAQRLAEHLIRRACRRLPENQRDDCYREWAAEASAILTDPDTSSGLHRTASALCFAADQSRGTRTILRAARKSQTAPRKPTTDSKRIAYIFFVMLLFVPFALNQSSVDWVMNTTAIGKLAMNRLVSLIWQLTDDKTAGGARQLAEYMVARWGKPSSPPPACGTAAR